MVEMVKDRERRAGAALALLGAAAIAMPLASVWAAAGKRTPTAAPLTAEKIDRARGIFNDFACGDCHVLADAGTTSPIGPALDGNAILDHALITDLVANGQGAMPGFGGDIPDEDIALLAAYILQVKK